MYRESGLRFQFIIERIKIIQVHYRMQIEVYLSVFIPCLEFFVSKDVKTVGNVQALVTNGKAGFALKAHGYCLSTSLV